MSGVKAAAWGGRGTVESPRPPRGAETKNATAVALAAQRRGEKKSERAGRVMGKSGGVGRPRHGSRPTPTERSRAQERTKTSVRAANARMNLNETRMAGKRAAHVHWFLSNRQDGYSHPTRVVERSLSGAKSTRIVLAAAVANALHVPRRRRCNCLVLTARAACTQPRTRRWSTAAGRRPAVPQIIHPDPV